MRRLALLSFLILTFSPALGAQTVRGRVVDAAGQPVSVALLTLLDAQGQPVRTVLTPSTGDFTFQTGGPGTFQLRVERIGLMTYTSPAFEVAAGEVREHPLTLSAAPIMLAAIRAETSSRCVVRQDAEGSIAVLWEEARKALGITAAVEAGGIVRLTGVHYVREMDGGGYRQTDVISRRTFSTNRTPFDALGATTLGRDGFARRERDGSLVYFGPSAAVLLSDPFLDQHCFTEVVENRSDLSLVGLAFEPVEGKRTVGIAGTLWLVRETGEVSFIEYDYQDPDGYILPVGGWGRVEFARVPGGAPIVARWWIRMPIEVTMPSIGSPGSPRITRQQEEGGIVLDETGAPIGRDDGVLQELETGAGSSG